MWGKLLACPEFNGKLAACPTFCYSLLESVPEAGFRHRKPAKTRRFLDFWNRLLGFSVLIHPLS